ncbi:MAG: TIGR03435 family protein [Acidobacteriia bacterium]|nr:TIGR03435 family protein [Terriglobia bacterium]MBV8906991.1 TIGR03435 family protein [Terriglobia bacterium]
MHAGFAALFLATTALFAQAPDAPRFEVASVKPTSPDQLNGSSGGKSGNGRLTMNNVTLKRCIMGAFGIGPNQIAGGPPWLDSDRYEIAAVAEKPVGDKELNLMLQSLLAERFQLRVHRETRMVAAYVLGVAKNGPKLQPSRNNKDASTRSGHSRIEAKGITMKRLAEVLSRQMDLPVVDQTGIEGSFDLTLEWAPDGAADGGPSIYTAFQEQLGLRLSSRKMPVEMLVIDHVERPSEN